MVENLMDEHFRRLDERRRFIQGAVAGTTLVALGGALYRLLDPSLAQAAERDDGRPRVPPGQRVIERLRPMGGEEGDPGASKFSLKIHGEVDSPFTLSFKDLLALPNVTQKADVHCVTTWSVLDATWTGVRVAELAARAGLRKSARYLIFEAAHGYTANIPIREALKPNVLVAHRLDDEPLGRPHGAPVRSVVPDRYFWKSAKWLTGLRFVKKDEPGFWETRGYSNSADPWKEERYS